MELQCSDKEEAMLRFSATPKPQSPVVPKRTPAEKGEIAEHLAKLDDVGKEVLAEELAATRPHVRTPKKQITLRLDVDVIEKFRATGDGWQARINETLRKAIP
jgi:uncharacterized protein (DUF4415 family)